jgi:hypothetical protein
LSVRIKYNETEYPVELKTDTANHYMVNNILNVNFFYYYLIHVLNVIGVDNKSEFNYNELNYTVSIIDHNVNIVELKPCDYLIFELDDYKIGDNKQFFSGITNKLEMKDYTTLSITLPMQETAVE